MCDFEDDFDNNDFMDDDSFEDDLEAGMDEPYAGDSEFEVKSDQTESKDDDLTVDPFFIGGAMGYAYEQGLRERKRRKRKRFRDED
jgi:hypothetical protein